MMQATNNLEQLTMQYLVAFASQDLDSLETMFSDGVVLFDPMIQELRSKAKVLEMNKAIFAATEKITLISKRIIADSAQNTVAAQLKLDFDGKIIDVVDIIEFNEAGKIVAITAYLDSKQVTG
ncbi:MAG: nuclear transport factor 2 family protein [Cyanobacteria bacterium]|nr:nuclear transport factor 2 family protein [Cyanobacteriota bacterium]MDA1021370.1 nuclear transport factor 2 family protein [Cyanobacteriota bacterium]